MSRPALGTPLLLLLAGIAATGPATAQDDGWTVSGDLRGGWFASEREGRDGARTDQDAFNARARVAFERGLAERWTFRTRVAARYSSDQDGSDAFVRAYAPTRTGAAFGDVTLDEAWFGYRAPGDGLRFKVGRFQTAFDVPGVASKALDRNDSPNIEVQWTDGVHLDMPVANGWRGHVIGQYRHRKGSGAVAYAPIDFHDSDSRATVFLGLENRERLGPVNRRMVAVTWMPASLADRGLGHPSREDYIAIDAHVAAEWQPREGGQRYVAGAEVGYAPNTPLASVAGTGAGGDAGGFAWQVQASVYDVAPRHNIGLAIGSAQAGWLISPDYRPNDFSAEVRYQWQFLPKTSMEARYRERTELDHPAGTQARIDRDVYVRLTHKF